MNYFDKLPTITYDGQVAKNILSRAKLSDQTKANRLIHFPYTIENSDRVDTLSNNYYDNPGYSWLIWLTNDVVDPYYDYVLSDEDFYEYIVSKYGSFEQANRKIKYYRVSWVNDEGTLTTSQFNILPQNHKKYYDPIVDGNLVVVGYNRNRDDTVVSTNKIMTFELESITGTFTVGEEVRINASNYSFITNVTDTTITVQHVTGTFTASAVITGVDSAAQATITSVRTDSVTIPDGTQSVTTSLGTTTAIQSETAFWTPVTYFDYEHELNENKKDIQLIDIRYREQIESELERVMYSR